MVRQLTGALGTADEMLRGGHGLSAVAAYLAYLGHSAPPVWFGQRLLAMPRGIRRPLRFAVTIAQAA